MTPQRKLPPQDEGNGDLEIPDFDFADMTCGFLIAASAAAQLSTLTVLLIVGFIAQKATRRSPGARAWVQRQATALLPDMARVRRQLQGTAGIAKDDLDVADRTAAHAAEPLALPLLDTLDAAPHLLVIGHTRGGKTTLLHALAQQRRQRGYVLVCNPDAAPGQWPGCKVYGAGDDYAAMAEGLGRLGAEVARRRTLRAQGQRHFAPLFGIIDEAQDVLAEVPGALALVEDVARRGAKLNIHLALGVQDKQVKTLGLEGKGQLRRNFLTVDVYHDGRTGQRLARVEDPLAGTPQTVVIPDLPDPEALITPVVRATPAAAGSPAAHTTPAAPPAAAAGQPAADTGLLAALLATSPGGRGAAAPLPPAPAPQGTAPHLNAPTSLNPLNPTAPQQNAVNGAAAGPAANAALPTAPQQNAVNDAAPGSAHSTVNHAPTLPPPVAPTMLPDRAPVERAGVLASAAPPLPLPASTASGALLSLLGVLGDAQDQDALQQLVQRLRALDPSDDELCRLIAALTLQHDRGYGKQAALETAFSCTKGGSAAWRRASTLYDAIKAL